MTEEDVKSSSASIQEKYLLSSVFRQSFSTLLAQMNAEDRKIRKNRLK